MNDSVDDIDAKMRRILLMPMDQIVVMHVEEHHTLCSEAIIDKRVCINIAY